MSIILFVRNYKIIKATVSKPDKGTFLRQKSYRSGKFDLEVNFQSYFKINFVFLIENPIFSPKNLKYEKF